MADVAYFTIDLLNAEGQPAEESNCEVAFRRTDNSAAVVAHHVVFPPKRRFAIPAFPREKVLYCDIAPTLYRPVKSRFFTPDSGNPQVEAVTVLRIPEAWTPQCLQYSQLPSDRFDQFKRVLTNSRQVDLKHGRNLGPLDAAYDTLVGPAEILAKLALLNLYAVTIDNKEPIGQASWFSFVKQIIRIDRERFVAEVKPELLEIVTQILANLNQYSSQGFFTESASMHYDNIPTRYTLKDGLITVKVRYNIGNIQFTLGKAQVSGEDVVLLDCDMDEHSNIIGHAGDLFLHVFSGGTHPIDIHEYIVHENPGVSLGYLLTASSPEVAPSSQTRRAKATRALRKSASG